VPTDRFLPHHGTDAGGVLSRHSDQQAWLRHEILDREPIQLEVGEHVKVGERGCGAEQGDERDGWVPEKTFAPVG
jgi:hypothetical protein